MAQTAAAFADSTLATESSAGWPRVLARAANDNDANLGYDPMGRLQQSVVGGITAQFLYDGPALEAEYDGAGAIPRRYAHGPGIDNPAIWFEGASTSAPSSYLIADRQGSIVAHADATRAAEWLATLETTTRRRLAGEKPGPKPKPQVSDGQTALFDTLSP